MEGDDDDIANAYRDAKDVKECGHSATKEIIEMELEEYYGIALSDGHAQTEHCIAEHGTQTDNTVLGTWEPVKESSADDFLRDLSSRVLGFEFVQMQAINNIFTCKDIVREVLESAPTSDDSSVSGHGART